MTRRKFGTLMIGLTAAVALAASPRSAVAKSTLFDVTGHWTGSATSAQGGTTALAADLQANTKGRGFAGTFTVTPSGGSAQVYNVTGKVGAGNKTVTMTLTASGKPSVAIAGKLDTTTPKISGNYHVHNKKKDHGTFSITR